MTPSQLDEMRAAGFTPVLHDLATDEWLARDDLAPGKKIMLAAMPLFERYGSYWYAKALRANS